MRRIEYPPRKKHISEQEKKKEGYTSNCISKRDTPLNNPRAECYKPEDIL